ncbi:acyl carrier protein [Paucibacter sp. APW11]|uniref:Acyl carrier protein n=1 Tax=Roseateles aquae TaxID=3077235 RepID=A0ABU3PI24_9BURK|nr:acyl carrier protein [Paucibacter sp. APW11]MDT9002099.1 acyl carrier protein [Paucibacter sp. APW11]
MTTLELSLCRALARLLEVDPASLSLTADLSEQGVDSIVALQLAREIEALVGREVDLEWLYDHPSIAGLAAFLAALPEMQAAPATP